MELLKTNIIIISQDLYDECASSEAYGIVEAEQGPRMLSNIIRRPLMSLSQKKVCIKVGGEETKPLGSASQPNRVSFACYTEFRFTLPALISILSPGIDLYTIYFCTVVESLVNNTNIASKGDECQDKSLSPRFNQ